MNIHILNHNAFLAQQSRIANRFSEEGKKVQCCGVKQSPTIIHRTGGFGISFQYPPEVKQALAERSAQVAECLPAISYQPHMIHTSISWMMAPYFRYSTSSFGGDMIEKMLWIIQQLLRFSSNCNIHFCGPMLYNRVSTLCVGTPNKEASQFFQILYAACSHVFVPFEPAPTWGTYVFTNHFVENLSPEEIADFIALMRDQKPLDINCAPTGLEISYWQFENGNLERIILESISF